MLQTNIIHIEETGSTNDAIRERKPTHGMVVAAEWQQAGRGQKGNSWESERGENLLFSIYVTPKFLPCQQQFFLSQAAALAVTDALAEEGIEAKIKWPNDIYAGDRKIAGMLIENSVGMNGSLLDSIIGIGLNVNQTKFISNAPNPVSMKQLTGKTFDREEVLNHILKAFEKRYDALEAGRWEAGREDYLERLYRWKEQHPFRDAQGVFTGEIIQVEADGTLWVKRENGQVGKYLFKQIEFILPR